MKGEKFQVNVDIDGREAITMWFDRNQTSNHLRAIRRSQSELHRSKRQRGYDYNTVHDVADGTQFEFHIMRVK